MARRSRQKITAHVASRCDVLEPMELSKQARDVLAAVVQEYILTGDAVPSGAVAQRQRIKRSPATVRHIMADLEAQGLLHQRHTSAGRVPTDLGLRLYVDRLMRIRKLSETEQAEIRQRYNISHAELQKVLRSISRLLLDLSKQCALVQVPASDAAQLSRIEFLPLRQGQLIAVLVLSSGLVENRLISLERDFRPEELATVHAYLNHLCRGKRLAELREFVRGELAREEVQYDDVRRRALEVGRDALEGPAEGELLIEGQSRLLDNPELGGREQLKALLSAMEEKRLVLRLLNETIQNAPGVQVFIGSETEASGFRGCAMIAAAYGQGDVFGTVGVLGPSSMNYPLVVPIVRFAADMATEILTGKESEHPTRR